MGTEQVIGVLNSGGILGLLVLVIISGKQGWWVWGTTLEREIQRADRAEAERDRMHIVVEERVVPALTESTRVLSVSNEKVEQLVKEVAELKGSRR